MSNEKNVTPATPDNKSDKVQKAPKAEKKKKREKTAWTLQRCAKAARRFKTEQEWSAGAPSSYKSAVAHGWVGPCLESMRNRWKSEKKSAQKVA